MVVTFLLFYLLFERFYLSTSYLLFVFAATAPSGTGLLHSRGF